ncbi:MAG: hypothetical protein WCA89_18580 [Terracidiphilus sp.]
MRVLMAQFKIKVEALEHFEAAREKILSALSRERPKGVRYTWCGLADGASFVGWLELDEGVENPLPGMEAGREFMERIKGWVVEPPIREELRVVGSYRSVH